jgi:NADH:ubiquinone oxidoreductase subunit E
MTPSGIEPVTFRFVVQYLNHCATISGIAGANQCFINGAILKHFGAAVTKLHCIHEEVRADQSTEMSAVGQLGSCSAASCVN